MPIIESWDAQLWSGAATQQCVLREPDNQDVRTASAALLAQLKSDPRNGIARVLTQGQLAATGGFSGAAIPGRVRAGVLLRRRVCAGTC